MAELYLIWSNEHGGWWGPNRHGYTRKLREAGRYDRAVAMEICREAVFTAMHIGIIAELPVRLADVLDFLDMREMGNRPLPPEIGA